MYAQRCTFSQSDSQTPRGLPYRPARPNVELLQQLQRVPGYEGTTAIVHRALSDVPAVYVSRNDNRFLRLAESGDVRYDIPRCCVGISCRLHLQIDSYRLPCRINSIDYLLPAKSARMF